MCLPSAPNNAPGELHGVPFFAYVLRRLSAVVPISCPKTGQPRLQAQAVSQSRLCGGRRGGGLPAAPRPQARCPGGPAGPELRRGDPQSPSLPSLSHAYTRDGLVTRDLATPARSLARSFTRPHTHSPTQLHTRSLTRSLTHALTHSRTRSRIHPPTHSIIYITLHL